MDNEKSNKTYQGLVFVVISIATAYDEQHAPFSNNCGHVPVCSYVTLRRGSPECPEISNCGLMTILSAFIPLLKAAKIF